MCPYVYMCPYVCPYVCLPWAAARFINKRIPGANVTPHFGKIQDKDAEFYQVASEREEVKERERK